MIKVAVCGSLGKMGKEVVETVQNAPDMELVGLIDKFYTTNEIDGVPAGQNLEEMLQKIDADVVVDFTQPASVFENTKTAILNGVRPVIGTTGLSDEQIAELKDLSNKNNTACLIAPNFALGAVLMMKFSQMASKYFANAEIIEYHHNQKKDAPSGTAIKTAQMMIKERDNFATGNCAETETITGSRGGKFENNIQIHSVRMPGYVASQEVIFGASGETLKIRHDSIDRKCFMSGVALAIRHIFAHNDFIYGLDNILN